jgi:hypothetical protein
LKQYKSKSNQRRRKMLARKMILTMIVCILVSGASWATTYYVDPAGDDSDDGTSWAEAFATIQKGIDTASSSDTIDVNEGTYYESIDYDGNAITVRSTDPDDSAVVAATVIDANGADYGVYFHNSEASSSVLKGFTITGAHRHGVYCDEASPNIENCVIENNGSSGHDGGGMKNYDCSPTVTDCMFAGNTAEDGGGMHNNRSGSSPKVINCVFANNSADDGGGMYSEGYSSASVTNCVFYGNAAAGDGGGMYSVDSTESVTNCVFYDNDADDDGGGMYNKDGSPTIVNCTFFGNYADDQGGGIKNYNWGDSELTNCIFWGNDAGNSGEEIYNGNNSDPTFSYCDIEDGLNGDKCGGDDSTDGGGNIDVDPEFANGTDPDGVDNKWCTFDDGLRIHMFSPCVDSADANDALSSDIMGLGRVYFNDANNMLAGDVNHADIGAYEAHGGLYGMEMESVTGSSSQRTVVTTGAKYVLTGTKMEMWRRVDPNTNTINPRKVAELQFNQNVGSLTVESYDLCQAVIQSTKATFDFRSDSLFFITAKDSFTYDHNSLIDAEWNAPLDANDWDDDANDRMWTDGYGGSLHAKVAGDPNPNTSENLTNVSMSQNDVMAHMVFPPKSFDFESLYGSAARPHVCGVSDKSDAADLMDPNGMDQYVEDDFGVFSLWTWTYTNGYKPVELDEGVWGYEIDPVEKSNVSAFVSAAHANGFKVVSYIYKPASPVWNSQDIQVTLDWMRSFQEEHDFDGWYIDNGSEGSFLDDYRFMRQVRADIGDSGVIYHHDSIDVWGNWYWYQPSPKETGLRAVMVDAYVNYTYTGETGITGNTGYDVVVHHPDAPYFRYFTGGYGLSQAYASHKLMTRKWSSITQGEKGRLIGENLNGTQILGNHDRAFWWDYFQPAFQSRKNAYNDPNTTFTPDVDWPLDPCTSWFRPATNNDIDFNDTTVTVTWDTDADSDSQVILTNNFAWSYACWADAATYYMDGYTADACSATLETSHSLGIPRTDLVPGDPYEYRIRSATDANVPDQNVYHHRSSFNDPNIVGHWKFEKGTGTTAYDSAGDNDGTIYGQPNWVDGMVDTYALALDGDGNYVGCGATNISEYGGQDGAVTISAWVKPEDVSKYNCATRYFGGVHYFSAGTTVSGRLRTMVRDVNSNVNYWPISSGTIEADTWTHIVFILDGGVGYKFYINGELDVETSNTNLGLYNYSTTSSYIGKGFDSSSSFEGGIDDVRIFNRVLGLNEVDQLYYKESAFWPTPADGAEGIDPNTDYYLNWRVGTLVDWDNPDWHFKVAFGSSDPPDYLAYPYDPNAYVPVKRIYETQLDPNTPYYWRIDTEKRSGEIVTGRVWSFETAP